MTALRVPVRDRVDGVVYAVTHDGVELPMIDIDHPSFAVPASLAALAPAIAAWQQQEAQQRKLPAPLRRLVIRLFLRGSVLARGLNDTSTTFLSGLNTYLLKLAPAHLGSWAARVDRVVADSAAGRALRLRLRDVVGAAVDAARPLLVWEPARPVCLVNIGGGPAPETVNIVWQLTREGLLRGRRAVARIYDVDDRGPAFCVAACAAAGLDVDVARVAYDWDDAAALGAALNALADVVDHAVVVVTCEGSLFEYGSDAQIVDNLQALRAALPKDAVVVGSVTSDSALAASMKAQASSKTLPRSSSAFASLASSAGWRVRHEREGVLSRVVTLERS